MLKRLLFILIILSVFGCKKHQSTDLSDFISLQVDSDIIIRKVRMTNTNLGFAVGGNRGDEGKVYKTTDGGQTWQQKLNVDDYSLYEVFMIDSLNGLAGGEAMRVYLTNDGGESWDRLYMWPNLPEYSVDISDVKNIRQYNDTTLLIACGDDYSAGLFVRMNADFSHWTYEIKDNELKALAIHEQTVLTAGYGYVGLYDFEEDSVYQQPQYKDFYVGAHIFDSGEMLLAGQNKFYKSTDGENWEVVERKSKMSGNRWQINDMTFLNENEGVAIGNYGLLLYSNDSGDNWREIRITDEPMLNSITNYEDGLYLSCENGKILVVDVSKIRE